MRTRYSLVDPHEERPSAPSLEQPWLRALAANNPIATVQSCVPRLCVPLALPAACAQRATARD
eukprot:scaffold94613_cov45-Tisochrysis_lutea.AAC.1